MIYLKNPSEPDLIQALKRPEGFAENLKVKVESILNEVKLKGDQSLKSFTKSFDGVELDQLFYPVPKDLEIPENLKSAFQEAVSNIEIFHKAQVPKPLKINPMSGITCEMLYSPVQRVGLYVPAGTAPLLSSLIMLFIPAKLAGVSEIIVASPPTKNQSPDPKILALAAFLGIDEILMLGGAQAIAAMAYGTESIPKVDKIFGPGNSFVNEAKKQVQAQGIAIDLPAGPSELMVVADRTANPSYLVSDLLSQAEHSADAQVVCLCLDSSLPSKIQKEIKVQTESLPRKEIIKEALKTSVVVELEDKGQALSIINSYAPEHLSLQVKAPRSWLDEIKNAGSIFLGNHSPEAAGDYASGTNHTLPTGGAAKAYGGVSLMSFMKSMTVQEINLSGLKSISKTVETLAEAEGLMAHAQSLKIRCK